MHETLLQAEQNAASAEPTFWDVFGLANTRIVILGGLGLFVSCVWKPGWTSHSALTWFGGVFQSILGINLVTPELQTTLKGIIGIIPDIKYMVDSAKRDVQTVTEVQHKVQGVLDSHEISSAAQHVKN